MKKIGLFVLSFIAILGVGVSFADVISDEYAHHDDLQSYDDFNEHYVDRCVKLQNVEIDNYRVIVGIVDLPPAYMPDIYPSEIKKLRVLKSNECLKWHFNKEFVLYLLDKSEKIDLNSIVFMPLPHPRSGEYSDKIRWYDVRDKFILLTGSLNLNGRYVDDSNPLTYEEIVYKVVKDGDRYKLEKLTTKNSEISGNKSDYNHESNVKLVSANKFEKFRVAWFLTVLIETIVLFLIAKLFWEKDEIFGGKILFVGILASTITLPLLWFVLPLFLGNGELYVVIGELLVMFVELFIIKYGLKVSRGKAILASIICNLCSFLIGLFIFYFI